VTSPVNVREARVHFSKLLARVMQGEEIVIAKAGKPVARLVPEPPRRTARRVPGIERGKLIIADDFDKMSKSELDQWYSSDSLPK
jgi:prevent-host-death family protein